jgi:hypothetical protein
MMMIVLSEYSDQFMNFGNGHLHFFCPFVRDMIRQISVLQNFLNKVGRTNDLFDIVNCMVKLVEVVDRGKES